MELLVSFIGIAGLMYTDISLCIIACGVAYGTTWYIENIKDKDDYYIKKDIDRCILLLFIMVAIKQFFEIFLCPSILKSSVIYTIINIVFGFKYGLSISKISDVNASYHYRKSARNNFYLAAIISSIIWIVSFFI